MTTVAASEDSLKDMPLPPAPFLSSVMQIEPQWIDYNGHLNMAYYNVMMDRAIDQMWLHLGIGPAYMKERHGSTFTAEAMCATYARSISAIPFRSRFICCRRREAAAHLRGIAPRDRGLAFGDLGEHDAPHRHEGAQGGAVPAGHSRRIGLWRACRGAAARRYRPHGGDAQAIKRNGGGTEDRRRVSWPTAALVAPIS